MRQGLLVILTACIGNTAGQRAWQHWQHWQHGSKLGHHSSRAASRHRIEPLDNWGQMRGKHRKHRKHSNQINCLSYLAANTRETCSARCQHSGTPVVAAAWLRAAVRFPMASVASVASAASGMGIGVARRAALLWRFASPCNQKRNTSAVTSADSALVSASTTRKRPALSELHFGRVVQGWSINAAGQLSTWANPPVQPKKVGATPRPSSSRASLSERSFQLSHLVRAQFRQCLVPEQRAHSSYSGRLTAPLARSLPPLRPVQARRSPHLTENTVGAVQRCGPCLDRLTPAAIDTPTGGHASHHDERC